MNLENQLLRAIAVTPLADRLDLVALTGWSRGGVYGGVRMLVDAGLAESVPHSSPVLPPTRRFMPTAEGLRRLADIERVDFDDMLRNCPVSEEYRRLLLARLDAVAVTYRVACALSDVARPLKVVWRRGEPQDADLVLPGETVLQVVRLGRAADRTSTAKRLWRLFETAGGSAVLVLAPDEVRVRHTRRLLARSPGVAFIALESGAAHATADDPVWAMPSAASPIDLRAIVQIIGPAPPPAGETGRERSNAPDKIDVERADHEGPAWLLPAVLKPSEKNAVDIVLDWPWIAPDHLGALLGVGRSRTSQLLKRLCRLGIVERFRIAGGTALAVTDRGIALVGRRDRVSIGALKKRLSVARGSYDENLDWRAVSGRRTRQLLRNVEHTRAVHSFTAMLARQARSRSLEIVQIDPPARASRYFRLKAALRSVQPDAYFAIRLGNQLCPFFLEWERRAVRPATMAARIAPYIRYYSTRGPLDDHGAEPVVMIVFEDRVAQSRFLGVAREEMERAGVRVPLLVSRRSMIGEHGPLGRVWIPADGGMLQHPFTRVR